MLPSLPDPRQARLSVGLFVALVLVVSGGLELAIVRSGLPTHAAGKLVVALMWTPGLASVLVRLVRREGFGDVSLRLGGRSTLAAIGLVCLYPLAVGAIAYGLAWSLGLAVFEPPASSLGLQPQSHSARFFVRLATTLLPGIPLAMITALGEELGWRGFFVQRLVDAEVPRPLLVSSLVWAAWHLPLILSGQYASGPSPALSAAIFVVLVVAAGYLFGWVRLTTGSLWPAAVAHAAWNSIIQGAFDASAKGAGSRLWVGESGVLVAAAAVAMTALLVRGPFPVRPRPDSPPTATLALGLWSRDDRRLA